MKKKIKLIVVTNNFPFFGKGGEVTFVTPEMTRLINVETDITVAPLFPEGPKVFDDSRLKIDLSLSKIFCMSRWRFMLFGLYFFIISSARSFYFKELHSAFKEWGLKGFAKSIWWVCQALLVERWLLKRLESRNEDIFVYTFWNTAVTVGCVLAKKNCHQIKVISRAHGYDLYPSRSDPPYIPFREWLYKKIDMILPISQAGFRFLLENKVAKEKIFLSYLGTEEPGFLAETSQDGVVRVVSCSFVVPIKRVKLIFEVLCLLAKKIKTKKFEWTHIGDGPLFDDLKKASLYAPPNLKVNLIGYLKNKEVLEFYRKNPIDLFLHLSESEGLPVSMMEVSSVGVPIFATDVGGVSEIVTSHSGCLFELNSSAEKISSILSEYVLYPDTEWLNMRRAARKVWESTFNADLVSSEFKRFLFLDK